MLGVDIGGTNIRLALINDKYKIINPCMINMREKKELKSNTPELVIDIITNYLEKQKQVITAIGIGIPGIIKNDRQIISCPNMPDLEDSNLYDRLRKIFGVPVFLEKDVNMIILADYFRLKNKHGNVIGFYIGTGFGCSMILNGSLFLGSRGFAGELGHIPLKGKNDKCGCGLRGCLEIYAGGKRLEILAADKNVDINDIFVEIGINDREIKEYIDSIIIGISSVVNIIDPDAIILGGGVIKIKGFPLEFLIEEIKKHLRTKMVVEELEIITTDPGKFCGCLGAGIHCFNRIEEKKHRRFTAKRFFKRMLSK